MFLRLVHKHSMFGCTTNRVERTGAIAPVALGHITLTEWIQHSCAQRSLHRKGSGGVDLFEGCRPDMHGNANDAEPFVVPGREAVRYRIA